MLLKKKVCEAFIPLSQYISENALGLIFSSEFTFCVCKDV